MIYMRQGLHEIIIAVECSAAYHVSCLLLLWTDGPRADRCRDA